MPTVLITGASRSIGLELTRQYADAGWRVIATCRAPARADALRTLAGDIAVERLDVTSPDDLLALVEKLRSRPIDLLFLNAGLNPQSGASTADTDYAVWPEVFAVNVIGPVRIATAFMKNVAASQGRTIVAMGSMAGSFASATRGNLVYRTSKAALHSAFKALAADAAERGVVAVVMHPGRVRVARAPDNPLDPADSVAGMRRVIAGLTPADNGAFLGHDGARLPW